MARSSLRGIRLEIALKLTRQRRLTLYALGKEMGKRSGDIRRHVHEMVKDEVLIASDQDLGPGTEYWLNEEWESEVAAARSADVAAGLLLRNQKLLMIQAPNARAFHEVVAAPHLADIVLWAAGLNASDLWAVAIDIDADRDLLQPLLGAFESAGCTLDRYVVDEVLGLADLRAASAWTAGLKVV